MERTKEENRVKNTCFLYILEQSRSRGGNFEWKHDRKDLFVRPLAARCGRQLWLDFD